MTHVAITRVPDFLNAKECKILVDAFERNALTFNPGWDQQCAETGSFTDVREIQSELKARGLTLASEAEADGSGPGSCMVIDPDGNPILIDQHR